MAAWLIPTLKAILPHVATIISSAAPVFTNRRLDATVNQTLLLQQQIGELQSAASESSVQIKQLAEQLQSTVAALEQAASIAESKLARALRFCVAVGVLSAVALCVAIFSAFAR